MPLEDLGYYFVTLLVCSVIHEAGHAVAAVHEDVRILSFGSLVFFVLPAAFVDLPTDQLLSLRPFQQLKVFTAGVWHNVVLAAMAYLLLFSIPTLSSPFYEHNKGVKVTWVKPASPVLGPTGLKAGDLLTSINDCAVKNVPDWRKCLTQTMADPVMSGCLDKEFVDGADTSVIQPAKPNASEEGTTSATVSCCGEDAAKNSLCFADLHFSDRPKEERTKGHVCLPVRTTLESSSGQKCNSTHACAGRDELCLQPSLGNEHYRLLQLKRQDDVDFLFVGSPAEVYVSVEVSEFVPIFSWLPPQLPGMVMVLSHYVASFSGALAVLNVVPCFMLDGQHMTRVLVDLIFPCYQKTIRSIIALTFTIVGTVLLALNICVGLWQLF